VQIQTLDNGFQSHVAAITLYAPYWLFSGKDVRLFFVPLPHQPKRQAQASSSAPEM
jgi:hypothetical protein